MTTKREWVWGTLRPDHLALAAAVAARWLENKRTMGIAQHRYQHTEDGQYQNLLGAEGEVAFRVLTGRPLPSVEEIASTWHGADVDGYAIKTVSKDHYRLVFDDADLSPAHTLVLMLNQKPEFAIIGTIDVGRAVALRHWGERLPRPAWVIEQHSLLPWLDQPALFGVEP